MNSKTITRSMVRRQHLNGLTTVTSVGRLNRRRMAGLGAEGGAPPHGGGGEGERMADKKMALVNGNRIGAAYWPELAARDSGRE